METFASVSDARTKKEITRLLSALAIPRDGVMLIHSAFKGLSSAGYRAESVLAGIVEYMSPGTLLMPTMSWRAVNPEHPVFDELETPSITGILTEIFRTEYATRRSLHPTHSVAGRGRLTDDLLASHHLDEKPCSDRSPWGLLDDHDAHVLLIGVEMDSCTLIHHIEQAIAPDLYLRPRDARERYICRDRHGREIQMYTRRTERLRRNFWQFEDRLAESGRICRESIAGVTCRGFKAADLLQVVMERLCLMPNGTIAQPGEPCKMM